MLACFAILAQTDLRSQLLDDSPAVGCRAVELRAVVLTLVDVPVESVLCVVEDRVRTVSPSRFADWPALLIPANVAVDPVGASHHPMCAG